MYSFQKLEINSRDQDFRVAEVLAYKLLPSCLYSCCSMMPSSRRGIIGDVPGKGISIPYLGNSPSLTSSSIKLSDNLKHRTRQSPSGASDRGPYKQGTEVQREAEIFIALTNPSYPLFKDKPFCEYLLYYIKTTSFVLLYNCYNY